MVTFYLGTNKGLFLLPNERIQEAILEIYNYKIFLKVPDYVLV